MTHPNRSHRKACSRRRPRRIQKKIDKRFGLLHCDRQAIYIAMLTHHTSPLVKLTIEQNRHISDLNREMMDIITDATARAEGTAHA